MAKYDNWLTEEGLLLIGGWAMDGLTEEQIAHNMGIRRETLIEWKKKFPNISNIIKKNKEVADRHVENALFKKAIGFTATDRVISSKKLVEYKDGKRVREVTVPCVVEVERYYPPDTTAEIFWMKKRKPEQWGDKDKNINVEGMVQIVDSIPD